MLQFWLPPIASYVIYADVHSHLARLSMNADGDEHDRSDGCRSEDGVGFSSCSEQSLNSDGRCCGNESMCVGGGSKPNVKKPHPSRSRSSLGRSRSDDDDDDDDGGDGDGGAGVGVVPLLRPRRLVSKVTKRQHPDDEASGGGDYGAASENNLRVAGRRNMSFSDSDSSNEDNECVYMYKGNGSSAMHIPEPNINVPVHPRLPSSPEMDFLEMDFDPGFSNGHESSDSSQSFVMNFVNQVASTDTDGHGDSSGDENLHLPDPTHCSSSGDSHSTPNGAVALEEICCSTSFQPDVQQPTTSHSLENISPNRSTLSEKESERQSPPRRLGDHSIIECANEKFHTNESTSSACAFPSSKTQVMLWSAAEALTKQAQQISNLSCGRTAIINVLEALGEHVDASKVMDALPPSAQNYSSSKSLVKYLIERSNMSVSHTHLIYAVSHLTDGRVHGDFFPSYPSSDVDFSSLLEESLAKGEVPVVAFVGRSQDGSLSDFWVYQMVYGIGPSGVFLASPARCVKLCIFLKWLCSPPKLTLKREEIMTRWNPDCDLTPLLQVADPLWHECNVVGQIVNVIREERTIAKCDQSKYFTIPVNLSPGILIFKSRDKKNPASLALNV